MSAHQTGMRACCCARQHSANALSDTVSQYPAVLCCAVLLRLHGLHLLQDLPNLMEQLADSTTVLHILTNSQFQLPDEAADTYRQLQRWPLALQDELQAAADRVRGYRGHFQEQLAEDQQQLQTDLEQLQVSDTVHCPYHLICLFV